MTFDHKNTHFFAETAIFLLKSAQKARKIYFFRQNTKKSNEKFGRKKKSSYLCNRK